MTIRAILWDFGDTLCDQTWMLAALDGEPTWAATYRDVLNADGLVDRWDLGMVSTADVAEAVANRMGASPGAIETHMRACCRNIDFFPRAMALVSSTGVTQALVTINPDIFSEVVVPHFGLQRLFQSVVTSWQERSADKGVLCEIARARLGGSLRAEECLLIDNRSENVAAWRARGGVGLLFTSEDQLLQEWPL